MIRLRFSSAQQVIDAYPNLNGDLTLPTNGDEPFAYIDRLLASQQKQQVLAFCAFLLPRKEAVQWLCKTIRSASRPLGIKEEQLLKLAEVWALSPTENARRAAFQAGTDDAKDSAAAWAALAAGWSGGNLSSDADHPIPPPAHLTGLAVKLGMQLLLAYFPKSQHAEMIVEFSRNATLMLKQDKA